MNWSRVPPFRAHPLVRGGHLQTVLGCYLPGPKSTYVAKLRLVPLADGDSLAIHDDCPEQWQAGDRVAVLFHGLGGSHQSGYMRRGADKLNARGIRVIRVDLRGSGAGFAYARHLGHAARSDDVHAAVQFVADLCPGSPLVIAGFSMGANMVLKYLGAHASNVPDCVIGGMAVAPPVDLVHCAEHIQKGMQRAYDQMFVRNLMRLVERRRREIPGVVDVDLSPQPKRLWDFDDRFTARLGGFKDAHDYYSQASSKPQLSKIRHSTLIITADDDPIVPISSFEAAVLSPTTELMVTRSGGHLGFISSNPREGDRRWMEWRLVDFVTSVMPVHAPLLIRSRRTDAHGPVHTPTHTKTHSSSSR
ncbi:alpha/beta hydrolase fold protein [Pirellula staleyi DSM 6068]|uniref:Alpha/beta hydrolase fold protein n=1 Tax=Pirellula staleyi (strain ATCC 27377 / DSM 6068 / ICPB 4128) TaxID=530564 RepID=D2R3W0_PIRSD|nr:alpha/beta fold hydrolase [Pirellula staleyi]ADB18809.1 alpha/beta hydrolase fold protein [Pirellula staleyi DSM 6068]